MKTLPLLAMSACCLLMEMAALRAAERPRLLAAGPEGLAELQQKAQTEWGQRAVARMEQALRVMDAASLQGGNQKALKEAGYKAAGHGTVFAFTGTRDAAAAAEKTVLREVIGYPLKKQLTDKDHLSRLIGSAFAYDLCVDAWAPETATKVRGFLLAESERLLKDAGGFQAERPKDEVQVLACAAAGLVYLAVRNDPAEFQAEVQAAEAAVRRYLDQAVAPSGFGIHGESPRQAALASGVLPFAMALRNTGSPDLLAHPHLQNALSPLVFATVPGAGMPILGPDSPAVDRSGLFALALDLAPEPARPGIVWLFEQVGGKQYLGIVRPHHLFYVLQSSLLTTSAEAPSDPQTWPTWLYSPEARLALLRNRWKDTDDLVFVAQEGVLRLIGRGTRHLSVRGQHATIYSDAPGAGAIDNQFGFPERWGKSDRVYAVSATPGTLSVSSSGSQHLLRFEGTGTVKRLKESIKQKKGNGKNATETLIPIPEGGAYETLRQVSVDFDSRDAVAVVAIADTLRGGGEAPREWVLHLGLENHFVLTNGTFVVESEDSILTGTLIRPADASFTGGPNPPYTNFVHLETPSEVVEVVLTLTARGKPTPAVRADADGFASGVQVGSRRYVLQDGILTLTPESP